jgi:nucleoside-diphosphate-sugar epimerase
VRVLVLGGSGFVGPFVVRRLLGAGHDVLMFHRGSHEPPMAAAAEHLHGDFGDLRDLLPRLLAWKPDVVVDVNPGIGKCGHGVLHFAGAVEHAVVLTSHDVYRAMDVLWGRSSHLQAMPVDERSALRTRPSPDLGGELAFDNLDVERAVASHRRLPATILRLPIVYGPLDRQRRLRDYVRQMDDGRDVLLDARLARLRISRGFVENVAHAVTCVVGAARAKGRIYNVSEPDVLSEAEWVREIGNACDWNGDVVAVDPAHLPPELRVPLPEGQHLFSTAAAIRADLSYREPVPRAEALRRAVEWEREQQASAATA